MTALLAGMSVCADTYYLKAGDGGDQTSFVSGVSGSRAGWFRADDTTGSFPAAGNDYVVETTLRTPNVGNSFTFAGDTLTIGSETQGGVFAMRTEHYGKNILTVNNLRFRKGALGGKNRGYVGYLAGKITVLSPESDPFIVSLGDDQRHIHFLSEIAGGETMGFRVAGDKWLVELAGVNSSYFGKFIFDDANSFSYVDVNNGYSLGGAMDTPCADAVQLGGNVWLRIQADTEICAANRGITLTGANAVFSVDGGRTATLSTPVTGGYAALKKGAGTLALAGAWTAGNLTASEGRVAVLPGFSMAPGSALVIGTGATLALESGADAGAAQINGGRCEVTLSGAADAATTQLGAFDGAQPIVFKLSGITRGVADGTVIGRVVVASPARALTADDFAFDLVDFGRVELSAGANGATVATVLKNRDVDRFCREGNIGGGRHWNETYWWQSGLEVSKDCAYIVEGTHQLRTADRVGNDAFGGAQLITRGDNITIGDKAVGEVTVRDWQAFQYCMFAPSSDHSTIAFGLAGDVTVHPSDNGTTLCFYSYRNTRALKVASVLHGSGAVEILGNGKVWFLADNSDFTGDISVLTGGTAAPTAATDYMDFVVADARNLGGELDAFRSDALSLGMGARLVATDDLAVTGNRGVKMAGTVELNVPEAEKELTLASGLTFAGATIRKTGAGKATFAGPLTAATGANALAVEAGTVKVSNAAVFASGFSFAFADGVTLAVDAAVPGAADGLMATGALTLGATLNVSVEGLTKDDTATKVVPLMTVRAADAAAVRGAIAFMRVQGRKFTLVETPVTVGDEACVRFSVVAETPGLIVIVR